MAGLPFNAVRIGWPPIALSPNSRVHYMQRHRAVVAYRNEAALLGKTGRRIAEPVLCVVPIVKLRRRRDLDNILASLKPAIDGLTDAGWWDDDSQLRGINLVPEVLVPSVAERCVVILSAAEYQHGAVAEMVTAFRSAAAAGNAYTAASTILNVNL